MNTPLFITFEGIEGSGKTTQIRKIADYLESRKIRCILTREPGSTLIGKKIRAILLDPENRRLDHHAELLLYMADRAQHIAETIKPALNDGKTVLCDRYVDSTIVYQGYARNLDVGKIRQLHQNLFDDLKPDVTFLFDLSPKIGLARAQKQLKLGLRAESESRFENEAVTFHEIVRAGYLELAQTEPERFRVIDASGNEEDIFQHIIEMIWV